MSSDSVARMLADETSARTRFVGMLWSISSDAFLSLLFLTIVAGQMWAGQLFFATVGCVWIVAVVAYNVMFVRSYR